MKKLALLAVLAIAVGSAACSKKGLEPVKPVYTTPETVDLGLSVKWANCNLGATSPEGTGGLYSWGETETKTSYRAEDYKWYKDKLGFMDRENVISVKKYNDIISAATAKDTVENMYGKIDKLTRLLPEDDAATAHLGNGWRTPTKAEWQELTENCNWQWASVNGVCGYKVSGKKDGYTGNSIFLPFTGIIYDTWYFGKDNYGMYWTSDLCKLQSTKDATVKKFYYDCACCVYIGDEKNDVGIHNVSYESYYTKEERSTGKVSDHFWNYESRVRGLAIRPVKGN